MSEFEATEITTNLNENQEIPGNVLCDEASGHSVLDGLDSLFDAAKDMEFDPYNGINKMRNHALALGALGFKVFPVFHMQPGKNDEPECSCCNVQRYFAKIDGIPLPEPVTCYNKPGKHPRGKWKELATNDPDEIRDLWNRKRGANIAIATGQPSGVFVIDLDGKIGMDSLRTLEAEHGKLPETLMAFSGRGDGLHLYFKAPAEEEGLTISAGTIGRGIDTRGTGGYIIGPGSNHESLRRYMWVPGYGPGEVELAELPTWFIEAMKSASNKTAEQKAADKANKKTSKEKLETESSADGYDSRFDVFDDAAKDMASRGWEIGDDGELLLGVDAYLSRIGEESKGKNGFHGPIYSALCSFFYHNGLEATDEEAKAVLIPVIKAAPCDDGRNVSRYATDRYLDERIADAREFIGMAKEQEAELIKSAYEKLKELIEGFSDFTDQKTVNRACEKLALLKLPPKLRSGLIKTLAKKIGTTEGKLNTALGGIVAKEKAKAAGERNKKKRIEGNKATLGLPGRENNPTLVIDQDHFDYMVTTAWDRLTALNAGGLNKYFQIGDAMVRLLPPNEEGVITTERMDADMMWSELNEHVTWAKPYKDGIRIVDADKNVAKQIIGQTDLRFPELESFVTSPFFAKGGELISTPGYHPGSKVFYNPPAGFHMPEVPEHPTHDDVAKARDLIENHVLTDFPFHDGGESKTGGKASKAHAIALLLQQFMRPMIPGHLPYSFVQKPDAGTGASLLIQTLMRIAYGRDVAAQTEKGSSDEIGKMLTAFLLTREPVLLIDNLNNHVHGAALANFATCGTWNDRRLGKSENIRAKVTCTTILAGNNVGTSWEIGRRCAPIGLDAGCDPLARAGFKHDLETWVPKHRGELVWACLTLIRFWIDQGKKEWHGTPLKSFEGWSRIMGGVLQAIGVEGFLENLDMMRKASTGDQEDWGALAAIWYDLYKDKPRPLGKMGVVNSAASEWDNEKSIVYLIEEHGLNITFKADAVDKANSLGKRLGKRGTVKHGDRAFRFVGGGRGTDNKQNWHVELVTVDLFAQAGGEMLKGMTEEAWLEALDEYCDTHAELLPSETSPEPYTAIVGWMVE